MKLTTIIILACISTMIFAQENKSTQAMEPGDQTTAYSAERKAIFRQLEMQDSLLFNLGFNQCDTAQVRLLISEDFEFYHDQSGITTSVDDFLRAIAGLCNLDYKATRELAKNSLEVHLLKNNGAVYGAIQTGEHLFYGQKGDQPKYLTSTAKFTHLWILEGGNWTLKRVLSFDHARP
ncbi:MAG: nuclear transport factor 2 family protein [Saprospiraceae bacterium]|nr:nuclear transport factor 2 family protein [Saprospiraceae bacterium]